MNLDIPVVLGSPFAFRVSVTVEASTGHAIGDPNPFTGMVEAGFATGPFPRALALTVMRSLRRRA